MKLEKEALFQRAPDIDMESAWIIPREYIDDYGNHLNEALALKIYEAERLKLADQDLMRKHGILIVLTEQHPRYHAQVFEGDQVVVSTAVYAGKVRIHFLHKMLRGNVIVQDNLAVGAAIGISGRPVRIPEAFLDEVISQRSTDSTAGSI